MTSVSAHHGGGPGVTVYAASKGGVLTITRGLARELAPKIRVNALAPGIIMTDLHRDHSSEEQMAAFLKQTPLARIGTPEDCAGAALFLCSDAGSFITGECIEINGGIWIV